MEGHTSLSTALVYVGHGGKNVHAATFKLTSRVTVDGKSSVCVICMKYRIILLIIIIISLGQTILSYMANTSRTHACTHAHTHMHPHTRTDSRACTGPPTHRRHHPGCRCYMGGVRPFTTKLRPLFACSAGYEWPVGASLK